MLVYDEPATAPLMTGWQKAQVRGNKVAASWSVRSPSSAHYMD
jgi:hypothetical protein